MNEYKALILNAFLFAQIVASNPAPSGERGDLVGSEVHYSAHSLAFSFPFTNEITSNPLGPVDGAELLREVELLGIDSVTLYFPSTNEITNNPLGPADEAELLRGFYELASSNLTVISADCHWTLVHGDEELKKPQYLSEAVVRDILFQNEHLFAQLKQLNPDLTMSIVGCGDIQVLSPEGSLVTNASQLLAIIKKGTAENPVILQVVFPRRVTR